MPMHAPVGAVGRMLTLLIVIAFARAVDTAVAHETRLDGGSDAVQEYTEWLQQKNITVENVRIACALVDWREDKGSSACHRYALYTKHMQEAGSVVVRVPNYALLSLEYVLLNTEVAEWLLRVGGVAYHNEVFVLWAMYQLHTCQYCPECDWCPFFRLMEEVSVRRSSPLLFSADDWRWLSSSASGMQRRVERHRAFLESCYRRLQDEVFLSDFIQFPPSAFSLERYLEAFVFVQHASRWSPSPVSPPADITWTCGEEQEEISLGGLVNMVALSPLAVLHPPSNVIRYADVGAQVVECDDRGHTFIAKTALPASTPLVVLPELHTHAPNYELSYWFDVVLLMHPRDCVPLQFHGLSSSWIIMERFVWDRAFDPHRWMCLCVPVDISAHHEALVFSRLLNLKLEEMNFVNHAIPRTYFSVNNELESHRLLLSALKQTTEMYDHEGKEAVRLLSGKFPRNVAAGGRVFLSHVMERRRVVDVVMSGIVRLWNRMLQ